MQYTYLLHVPSPTLTFYARPLEENALLEPEPLQHLDGGELELTGNRTAFEDASWDVDCEPHKKTFIGGSAWLCAVFLSMGWVSEVARDAGDDTPVQNRTVTRRAVCE